MINMNSAAAAAAASGINQPCRSSKSTGSLPISHLELLDGPDDVILTDRVRPAAPPPHDCRPQRTQLKHAAIHWPVQEQTRHTHTHASTHASTTHASTHAHKAQAGAGDTQRASQSQDEVRAGGVNSDALRQAACRVWLAVAAQSLTCWLSMPPAAEHPARSKSRQSPAAHSTCPAVTAHDSA